MDKNTTICKIILTKGREPNSKYASNNTDCKDAHIQIDKLGDKYASTREDPWNYMQSFVLSIYRGTTLRE